MSLDLIALTPEDEHYPEPLRNALAEGPPETVYVAGGLAILERRTLALFCSVKCPGAVILETYALAQRLRQLPFAVLGAFHSPVERECLRVLLLGPAPLVICPAAGLVGMRLPAGYAPALEGGRLLLISPRGARRRRFGAEAAQARNAFVAALADILFIAYAAPGGRTEALCRALVAERRTVYTFAGPRQENLHALGAIGIEPTREELNRLLKR